MTWLSLFGRFLGAVSDVEMQEHYDEFFEVSELLFLLCVPRVALLDVMNVLSAYFSQKEQLGQGVIDSVLMKQGSFIGLEGLVFG